LPTETSPTVMFSSSVSVDDDNSDTFHSCSSSANISYKSLLKLFHNNNTVSRKKVLKQFYTNIDTVTKKLLELKLQAITEDYDLLCIC